MKVIPTTKEICDEFVSKKHYSRRPSIFWSGFALVEDDSIQGVAVFGQPSPPLQKYAFKDREFRMYELARVVVQTKTKNAASFLIGGALQQLEPRPCAVVSFADSEQGHAGYIYQATNWLYTGATVSHDHLYIVDGKRTHPMSLRDKGITNPKEWADANGIETVKPMEKHRYFYLCGDRRQKRDMLARLAYPVVDQYPKIEPHRYDDGDEIVKRLELELF